MEPYKELNERLRSLTANWSHPTTDRLTLDWLAISSSSTLLMLDEVNALQPIYWMNKQTGDPVRWDISLIPRAVETLRRHMILEDLADV